MRRERVHLRLSERDFRGADVDDRSGANLELGVDEIELALRRRHQRVEHGRLSLVLADEDVFLRDGRPNELIGVRDIRLAGIAAGTRGARRVDALARRSSSEATGCSRTDTTKSFRRESPHR